MPSSISLFYIAFIVSYITYFVIYFLWREYSIAKKMFNNSKARKYIQKKIFPFSTIGILTISFSLPAYFYLPEQLQADYTFILYYTFLGFMSSKRIIDYMSSKNLDKQVMFVYLNKEKREECFSLFIIVLSASIVITTLALLYTRSYIPSFTTLAFSFLLCLNIYKFILSFNEFKIVEEGIIHRFRLTKWNDIRAYRNILDSSTQSVFPIFKISFCIKPSILQPSSFIQIPISSQDVDMDSINQILAERLPGKNI